MSTEQVSAELLKIVNKAAIDGTLTSQAAKQVREALEDNEKLRTMAADQDRGIQALKAEINILKGQEATLTSRIQRVTDREIAATKREETMLRLELEAAHHKQRVEDHKEMVRLIFRNIDVRRNVFNTVPPPSVSASGGCGPSGYVEKNDQEERQE